MKPSLLGIVLLLGFFSFSQEDLEVIIQTGHAGKINSLLYSQDNTKIISAGKDAKLVLWDVKTGKQEREAIVHDAPINQLEVYDDSTLVTCSDDSTVKLINRHNLEVKKVIGPFKNKVKSIAVNPKNKTIFVGARFLHIVKNDSKITTLKAMSFDHFDAVHFMKETGYVVYGGRKDKFTRVIDANSLDIIKSIQISATSIDSYNKEFVVGDLHGVVYYFNLESLKEKRYTLPNPLIVVNDVKLLENKIIIARSDGIIEELYKKSFITYGFYKGHLSEVTGIALGNKHTDFITSDSEGNIILWNEKSKKMNKLIRGESNPINVAKFSKSGEELLIGYSNGILRKINLISNNVVSNRLYFSQLQKINGWKYSIISLDEQVGHVVSFKALKAKTFDENTDILAFCEIWQGEWDLKKNQISLTKRVLKDKSNKLISDQSIGKKIVWQTYFLDEKNLKTESKEHKINVNQEVLEITNKTNQSLEFKIPTGHNDRITGVDFNNKHGLLITYGWDGSLKFWSNKKFDHICNLYLTGQRDFLWLNPRSYYFSSKGALDNVAFSWKGNVFPFDQFDVKYNRPDLIYEKLPFLDEKLVEAMKRAYYKRLYKLGVKIQDIKVTAELPTIKVNPINEQAAYKDKIEVQCIAEDQTFPISEVKIYVNGVPLKSDNLKIQVPKNIVDLNAKIPLTSGDNVIEIYAVNSKGIKSLKETFKVESDLKYNKPDLYLITVGISKYHQSKFDLNYAAKDARDIISKLSKSNIYENIYSKQLTNHNATKDSIAEISNFVKNADFNDVVIIFAAGHGVLNENLDYYFASHDMDFSNPDSKGISFDSFQEILEATKSRNKLLMLDACHSGEIDKEEIDVQQDTIIEQEDIQFRAVGTKISLKDGETISPFQLSRMLFADTRESNGATVISSASGTEFAIEGKDWQNGVFTYSFLRGIESKEADLNRDGQIKLSEMQTYLNTKVLELTNGMQSPNTRVENLKSDFRLW